MSASLSLASAAKAVVLCGGSSSVPTSDNRLLGHYPYPAAARSQLARPPRALSGQCQAVHPDMRADFEALLMSARSDPSVGRDLIALSCYRSRQHQAGIFCRNGRRTLAEQALQIAPPGYSEHSTGYAIDFGSRRGGCNLIACFAGTKVGRWLAANAPNFGFELSFPKGNTQGVAFEPWHWRWVGHDNSEPSARAHAVFAVVRKRFPSVSHTEAPIEMASVSPFAGALAGRLEVNLQTLASLMPLPTIRPATPPAESTDRPTAAVAPIEVQAQPN